MKILLDPGHGGSDPGAVNDRLNLREKTLALAYSEALYDRLVKAGHRVKATRREDVSLDLRTRVEIANAWRPDLFVSLHANSSDNHTAHGIEVWTSPGTTPSDGAATRIYSALLAEFPERNFRLDVSDGDVDKEAAFYVLTKTRCAAVLLELGFLSHDMEAEWLDDEKTLARYATAIAMGIEEWALARV